MWARRMGLSALQGNTNRSQDDIWVPKHSNQNNSRSVLGATRIQSTGPLSYCTYFGRQPFCLGKATAWINNMAPLQYGNFSKQTLHRNRQFTILQYVSMALALYKNSRRVQYSPGEYCTREFHRTKCNSLRPYI